MSSKFPQAKSATELSALLESGATTSLALVEDSFARIDRANGELGAFVHLDRDGARAAAIRSDTRICADNRASPMDGIPISIKDNIWVSDLPAQWGSRMWSDFVPPCDDIVIERLRAAGAVIMGKTNTPELALSGRTDSPLHGPARNPWDTELTPGGSSGGAAASVAAGLVPMAVGTDAGGSTRLPASYTGLYGLRPSKGRIPRHHGFPPVALDFQVVGLLTRTLDDLKLLYSVVAGPDSRDAASMQLTSPDNQHGDALQTRRFKIGWFAAHGSEPVDKEVASAVAHGAKTLAHTNCEIAACDPPYEIARIRRIWSTISAVGAARIAELHPESWQRLASAPIAAAIRQGLELSGTDYVRALDELEILRNSVSANWGEFDAFVCPSAASPAWALEEAFPASVNGHIGHPMVQNTFATWVNAIGHPALSVPVQSHADGRPCGVQIVGRFGSEDTIMEIARRLAETRGPRPAFPSW